MVGHRQSQAGWPMRPVSSLGDRNISQHLSEHGCDSREGVLGPPLTFCSSWVAWRKGHAPELLGVPCGPSISPTGHPLRPQPQLTGGHVLAKDFPDLVLVRQKGPCSADQTLCLPALLSSHVGMRTAPPSSSFRQAALRVFSETETRCLWGSISTACSGES